MILVVGQSVRDSHNNVYVLDEIIGQGGFGYVFKSHRVSDNTIFAIKTTLPSFGDNSSLESFKNEIATASHVSGDNVIRYEYVHNGEEFPEYPPYIIMEYADGGTLTQILKGRRETNKQYSNVELVHIYKQLAQGMRCVNAKLIHRDIKPDNILLCGNQLKISDFGLSKVAIEGTRTLTFKGGGTPLYMSPEAWDLSKNTIQMDIYAMGMVFYELATLQYPYIPMPTTYEECKAAHMYSQAISASKINPNLSASTVSIINRMLEKSAKRRFANWDEIIELLDVQHKPASLIDSIAATAVAAINKQDAIRQEQVNRQKQKQHEDEDFIRLVRSQFEQSILSPIIEFAETVNGQYAGKDKLTFPANQYTAPGQTKFYWKLIVPPNNSITINFEAILKDNFQREVPVDRVFRNSGTRKENYIPQYNKRNILGWGEATNKAGLGFNIILLDSGELYGDWLIMNNRNNLSGLTGRMRREPFAFSLAELPEELPRVQMTHLYQANFEEFTAESFLRLINFLAFGSN